MSSHSKKVGDIGEISVMSKLISYENIQVSKPFGDNCIYDLIIDVDGKLYKTQVKTTERVKNGKMRFNIRATNPWKIKSKIYTKDDIDLFAFYCLENKYLGLAKVEEVGNMNFDVRFNYPKNGRKKGINLAEDFDLNKRIKSL